MGRMKFQLFIQPKLDVLQGNIVEYEILLRDDSEVPKFPLSELEAVLANEETYYVFSEWFIEAFLEVLDKYPSNRFAINIAPQQLFYAETLLWLDELRSESHRITVEITEDIFDVPAHKQHLNANDKDAFILNKIKVIYGLGYHIAMDDVSCGLNSLERVMSYLPYIIEIKFSLIHFKSIDLEDLLYFIKAWANFAQKNNLDFVVEGIETKETMAILEVHGVSIFQGYLVNKPFPA
ncbi:EAL domain-containing protein [Listeria ivanovii]|uniref:EAL domain-containing protein n=1 Tax=Listeria ivanovii TaxID=1638 RepID=UPI00098D592F|nr:EAL domain-containing protein [Listeria ivanovii]MBK1966117.1 EAL domain-containing protein [Listeria ivanovii subsp. londoniensis]MBK1985413.1 EAL domain-containing protein [Listeria ivanovii subsp. londoniensis]MBK1996797.1 EAL domain-containing protein [Listeria ivanovii subsp. londoniensis]MBM5608794.1 EAL domain-containing protein [Listeria ivanovii]MBM5636954.1 EAL domain-containing protein [Listeria ivanovii]